MKHNFSITFLSFVLFFMFSCIEKDSLIPNSDFSDTVEFINVNNLHQSVVANGRAVIDTSLFNISSLSPKLQDRLAGIKYQYTKSIDGLDPAKTGYPVWGGIMGNEAVSIIPTVRPNLNLSYEFLVVFENELEEQKIAYVSGVEQDDFVHLINILNYPILTEASREDLYGLGGTTILGIDIIDGGGVSEGGQPGNDPTHECYVATFISRDCLSVSQDGVGELCCKCETNVTTTRGCRVIAGEGGGGVSGGSDTGGGGIGGSNGTGGGGPNIGDQVRRHLDSLRNEAPDQIINNVDCQQEPCLCEVINKYAENPNLFENLSNEVSQMIRSIFEIPNFQSITITTTAVEGTTLGSNEIARHTPISAGNFPLAGIAHSEIIFNSNYQLNCTQVHLAATLLHESMNAYIDAQRLALTSTDFNRLYPLFSTGFNLNDSHHRTIADMYIGELSRSLRHMFPDPKLTDEFIEALTWQGLENTPAYSALVSLKPPGFEQRVQDINRIASCQGYPHSPQELNAMGLVSCF
ncbi:hypothetical protein [Neolewinella agarilytica]|uniref:Uncharacterized protein n=1 Tax=Neolewinella agarilytica TaxID=478744 RepID=A0A1H9I8C4_9BACT|nr:hypothetical protein [Neolewinella agarilytica]SEQ70792.1 hypothetical protein SAMN05444359_11482 [Neolewinella agarilytica]